MSPCTLCACLLAVRALNGLGLAGGCQLSKSLLRQALPTRTCPTTPLRSRATRAAPALGTSQGTGPGTWASRWAWFSRARGWADRQGLAVRSWRPALLQPCSGNSWWPWGMCSWAVGRDTGLQAFRTIMAYWCPLVPHSVHHFSLHSTDPTGHWCFVSCCWLTGHPTFLVAKL